MDIIPYATALHRSASGANATFAPVMPICLNVGNHDDGKDAGDAYDDDGNDDGEGDADADCCLLWQRSLSHRSLPHAYHRALIV